MSNRHHIRGIDLGSAAADYVLRMAAERDRLDPGKAKFRPGGKNPGRKPGSSKKRVTLPTLGSLAKLLTE